MDIFTTQIAQAAQAVTVPIKPDKLKVKALVKKARLEKLKQGIHELDDSEYALYQPHLSTQEHSEQLVNEEDDTVELSVKAKALEYNELQKENKEQKEQKQEVSNVVEKEKITTANKAKAKENNKHLDIFI